MSDGVFIKFRRPRTKKEVIEAVKNDPDSVEIECTSIHGENYSGLLKSIESKHFPINFCGPDPHRERKFYGTIKQAGDTWKVT